MRHTRGAGKDSVADNVVRCSGGLCPPVRNQRGKVPTVTDRRYKREGETGYFNDGAA